MKNSHGNARSGPRRLSAEGVVIPSQCAVAEGGARGGGMRL